MTADQRAVQPGTQLIGKRVLIVEHDEALRRTMFEALASEGALGLGAADGNEALAVLRTAPIDLVILDMWLPTMTGWEFRVAQKKDPEIASIPVLIISADLSAQAEAIDADGFLPKPFGLDTFILAVRRILGTIERGRARNARLTQIERLSSIGLVAAGIAHEVNNPLSYVLANLQFLKEVVADVECSPAVRQDMNGLLEETVAGALRIGRLVSDLGTLSNVRADKPSSLDARVALATSVNIARKQVELRGRLIVEAEEALPVVADLSRLGQVLLNLLINAAHALQGCARDEAVVRVRGIATTTEVTIEVSDNGQGIDPAHLPRLFEPFFTTKAQDAGTGLGLSICHDIVTAMGGRIEVESVKNAGSTFRLVLPRAPAALVAFEPASIAR